MPVRARIAFAVTLVLLALAAVPLLLRQEVRAARQELVSIAPGSVISLSTPRFLERGSAYAFTWPGGGPPQTFTVKELRADGWILVDVAEENVDPAFVPLGSIPTRWLNVALATSIQEMRPPLQ